MCVCGGGHCSCNASQSQPDVQKNSRALVRGMGGGACILREKNARIQKSPHLRKNGHMFPCILYFFIHPQPYNIGPARQQPRNWGSLLISLSLVGEGGTAITY